MQSVYSTAPADWAILDKSTWSHVTVCKFFMHCGELKVSPDTLQVLLAGFTLMDLSTIQGFNPTWSSLIEEVLVTWVKFLESSGYCTVINYTFNFSMTNIFGYSEGAMTQIRLIKHKFFN